MAKKLSCKFNQILYNSYWKNLTWKQHINNLAIKLSKITAILSKIRDSVDMKTLKSIYHVIFFVTTLMFYWFGYKAIA